ncbi:MAG: tetraacyldisaccharide 4'-kinase [Planctomycetota bacterium]
MSRTDRQQRPPIPRPLGALLEPIYRRVLDKRNASFDAGDNVSRFNVPVVSVGNISVGGTGKTPFVHWVVRTLRDANRRPAVVMRGYKSRPGRPSDEFLEHIAALPEAVTVIANPNRAEAISDLLTDIKPPDCIVLDDGFQHRRVARDVDVVLIDATRSPLSDRCLPAGWLREPIDSLERADLAVLTRTDAADPDEVERLTNDLRIRFTHLPVAHASHAWTTLETLDGEQPVASLEGTRVVLACAIGHPASIRVQAEALGAEVTDSVDRPDHHAWSQRDLRAIEQRVRSTNADAALCTRKDWVKIQRLDHTSIPFIRPRLGIAFRSGEQAATEIIHAALA